MAEFWDFVTGLLNHDKNALQVEVSNAGDIGVPDESELATAIGAALTAAGLQTILRGLAVSTLPPIKYVKISASASGDNIVVAAVTGKKIRAYAYTAVGAAAVGAKWCSDVVGGTQVDISGVMAFDANGGAAPAFDGGLFETGVGKALVLNLASAVAVGGHIAYAEI
jgi:hypothetical protein